MDAFDGPAGIGPYHFSRLLGEGGMGNVYLAKVQNVLPGMEAAFVDIGTPKNAVLYRGDLQFDAVF